MWDLKVQIFEFFQIYYILINVSNIFNYFLNYSQIGITTIFFSFCYQFPQNTTFVFGLKFLFCISFLVLIRGGTPRYRYDYLTKLGWLKFISFILLIFISSILYLILY